MSDLEVALAHVVSFVSEKGGVGKTTACYHIAVALQRFHNKRVLVIDADYQRGGVSGRFFPDVIETFASGSADGTSIYHFFQKIYSASQQKLNIDVREWVYRDDRVDVVIADPRLSTVSIDKLPSSNNIKENNKKMYNHISVIDNIINDFFLNYDYILIDSHPEVSDVLRSVIYASDYCVSPVKLDRQSSIGVATIIGEINNVNADIEMISSHIDCGHYVDTKFAGAMGMMAREWGGDLKQSEYTEFNRLRRTGGVFSVYVTEGDGLRQAAAQRIPVFDVCTANADKQSGQLKRLAEEFLEKCS